MDTKTPNNSSSNEIPKLKTPIVALFIGLFCLLIIIITFILLFNHGIFTKLDLKAPNKEITADVFIVITFLLIIGALVMILIPNLKNLLEFITQIKSVFYVVLYTIFLILFFRSISSDTLNKYAFFILPISILLAIIFFYFGVSSNYIKDFNLNYERVKNVILFFCLITMFIIYYTVDPGGYIKKYFGFNLLITILLSVFSFILLIIVLTLPDNNFAYMGKNMKGSTFFENITKFPVYGSILFLLFIIIITIGITTYPGGFFNDVSVSSGVMILVLLISIIWSTVLIINIFPEISNKDLTINKLSLLKRALLILFEITISGLIIWWIVYNIQNFSGSSSILSLILNVVLVVIVLTMIYKTIHTTFPSMNSNKNGFFSLITNLFLYIPCLLSISLDNILKYLHLQYDTTTTSSLILLIVTIILIILYFHLPSIEQKLYLQGGKLIINNPIYINKLQTIATYEDLNTKADHFDYQYGLSFWVFLDAMPPSTNGSYDTFTSILNYGNKPNILYKANTNTLMITMDQKNSKDIKNPNIALDLDDKGNRIIYKKDNILLQKWNNIIINFSGGTLDIFYNNELVKSVEGVVPYMTYDTLNIGENTGLSGGICSVLYFQEPLTSANMYYLYNVVKDNTPPILENSTKTLMLKH